MLTSSSSHFFSWASPIGMFTRVNPEHSKSCPLLYSLARFERTQNYPAQSWIIRLTYTPCSICHTEVTLYSSHREVRKLTSLQLSLMSLDKSCYINAKQVINNINKILFLKQTLPFSMNCHNNRKWQRWVKPQCSNPLSCLWDNHQTRGGLQIPISSWHLLFRECF